MHLLNRTLQVALLDGPFLLNIRALVSWQASKPKGLVLVVAGPFSSRKMDSRENHKRYPVKFE
jgi:hypothetical protein